VAIKVSAGSTEFSGYDGKKGIFIVIFDASDIDVFLKKAS
jgi:hypothetical protein